MALLLEPLESALDILQAENDIIQRRPHLLLLQKLHHVFEHAARSKIYAPKDTKLPQRAHHVWCLLPTAQTSNHSSNCDQAMKPECTQRLGHCRGAHYVDNVVDSAPFWCKCSGQLAPVRILPVVDNVTSTEGEEPVCFFVRASYRDNMGASCNCNLVDVSELISLAPSPTLDTVTYLQSSHTDAS